jgi:hypothetical protein
MNYDGSINIDTRINETGMNRGTRSINQKLGNVLRSAKRLGVVLGVVFSVRQIVRWVAQITRQFDIMSSSLAPSLNELKNSFDQFKGAIAGAAMSLISALAPYIIIVVNWLTRLLNVLSQIIIVLFGVQRGMGGVASGAGKAAKAAKGMLAPFDELNVLNKQDDSGGGGGGVPALPGVDVDPALAAKIEELKRKFLDFFDPAIQAAGRLWEAIKRLGGTVWDGLVWVWDNILVPFGEWLVREVAPRFLDLLAEAVDFLNDVLIILKPIALWFWEEFLKPLAEWAGQGFINTLDMMIQGLKDLRHWMAENEKPAIVLLWVIGTLVGILVLAKIALLLLASPIILIGLLIVALMVIIGNWGAIWDWVGEKAKSLWTTIKQIFILLVWWFTNQVLGVMGSETRVTLDGMVRAFETAFQRLPGIVRDAMNGVIGFINMMLRNATTSLNALFGITNAVRDVMGFPAIPAFSAPQIPRLATGAVIPPNSEFLAILGDQKSGRNIEAPEGLIRQIIREEMGGMQTNVKIDFVGSLAALARELKPEIDIENTRVGGSLVTGAIA